eukprot:TRINITY_DN2675_c0_g1_i2.p1 TRINITY_DN2675_c0_g1~~TRINITY_DN2675_c0_g1_i2.p1  ORF type:complete len:198 (+),score=23.43 TRINITY_DN2675_c0_g1_i2:221-814(+)
MPPQPIDLKRRSPNKTPEDSIVIVCISKAGNNLGIPTHSPTNEQNGSKIHVEETRRTTPPHRSNDRASKNVNKMDPTNLCCSFSISRKPTLESILGGQRADGSWVAISLICNQCDRLEKFTREIAGRLQVQPSTVFTAFVLAYLDEFFSDSPVIESAKKMANKFLFKRLDSSFQNKIADICFSYIKLGMKKTTENPL